MLPVLGIRYPLMALRARRRPRVDLLDETRLDLRVRLGDIDVYGHINNGRYLSLMDLGRIDNIVRSGLGGTFRRHRLRPVAGGATIRFRRELRLLRRYSMHTRVAGGADGWWYFEQRLDRDDGTLAALAWVKVAVLDASGRRTGCREVLEAHGAGELVLPELPVGIAAWQGTGHG